MDTWPHDIETTGLTSEHHVINVLSNRLFTLFPNIADKKLRPGNDCRGSMPLCPIETAPYGLCPSNERL